MSLLVIILCLILERFLLDYENLRQHHWFDAYFDWFRRARLPAFLHRGISGVVTVLAPPVFLVALFQDALSHVLAGVFGIVYAGFILLLSLGPRDLDRQVSAFGEARDAGDGESARRLARELIQAEPPPPGPGFDSAVAAAVLKRANTGLFGPLFWFFVLGPFGAALYRLSSLLTHVTELSVIEDRDFGRGVRRLQAMLDWAPARLAAFGFALSGSFTGAVQGWKRYSEERVDELDLGVEHLLSYAGLGALGHEVTGDHTEGGQTPGATPEAAMALVWRTLVVILGIVAVIAIVGAVSGS